MDLYFIRRRSGWKTGEELEAAAKRSTEVADSGFPNEIAWIRSYVVKEPSGELGTVCIYQAASEEAVRKHADEVGMPADEVLPIADTVLVRPDPEPAAA
jgi:Protein of unknown function (DUF4242)